MAPPERARAFDPNRVGTWEWRAWVAYYQRRWLTVLGASVGLVRAGFGMPWAATVKGAWLVLRANQLWAPYPDNDPVGARRYMERFYLLVASRSRTPLDARVAARLELDWWRVHREEQHAATASPTDEEGQARLAGAIADLYAFVYGCTRAQGWAAADLRAQAMVASDRWVAGGCRPADPLLDEERVLLVRSYAALLAAVHR